MALTVSDICMLFARKGGRALRRRARHAARARVADARRARKRPRASAALVTAALLHDLGHLLNDQGETPTLRGVDDLHQYAALPFLRALFGDDVLEPIRLHVDAKRYLCATRPDYYDALSADSKRSLALQGGVYSPRRPRPPSSPSRMRRTPSACGCGTISPRWRAPRRRRSPISSRSLEAAQRHAA